MEVDRKRAVLIHGIGVLIARAVFFQMNPLAIGYFTAAYLDGAGGGFALFAILLGAATVMAPVKIWKLLLTMFTTLIIMEIPGIKKRKIPHFISYAIPSFLLGLYSMVEATSGGLAGSELLLTGLEVIIAYVSAGMFKSGIHYILGVNKGVKMNNEQMVSMAVIIAVIIYAVPQLSIPHIAPLETAVFFTILFFTYKYGVGQGTVTGAVCGLALNLRGAAMSDAGLLTMMGIIPAVFRGLGRFPTAAIYMATAALMGLVYRGNAFSGQEIGALLSAVVLFLLLPPRLTERSDDEEAQQSGLTASNHLKKIAKSKMQTFSESFLKLSRTLDTITEKQMKIRQQEINRIFEDISDKLCKNCSNCSECWEKNFQQTYEAACNMFDVAEKNGVVTREDIPLHFLTECCYSEQFVDETNHEFEIAKLNHIWYNRIAENRGVISDQLREVSSVIKEMTGAIYESALVLNEMEDRVARHLKSQSIQAKDITIIERSDKRKEIYLNASLRRGKCITTREAASMIGDAMGIKMKPSEVCKMVITKEYDHYTFMEDTKFKVLTGVARAMKENVSGDSFSVLKMENGEVMLALSDGMGTGVQAGEESETVLALLEQMMEAGFKPEAAIKLINSSLVLNTDRQMFSTIDLSMINLFTGVCEFVKIGAAAAFIKRDNWVETISSTTLPIGVFGDVDYDMVTKKLYEGDMVIMVTDGILDSVVEEEKEAFLENFIMEIKSNNPQEIANKILENALSQSNFIPRDDMTVITAGIWQK